MTRPSSMTPAMVAETGAGLFCRMNILQVEDAEDGTCGRKKARETCAFCTLVRHFVFVCGLISFHVLGAELSLLKSADQYSY